MWYVTIPNNCFDDELKGCPWRKRLLIMWLIMDYVDMEELLENINACR